MTTTADKIRALMINKDRPELGGEWNLALEAAAALVEAEPQAVRVKQETDSHNDSNGVE